MVLQEVEAFSSVHDMIHAAIQLYGGAATLQQAGCSQRGWKLRAAAAPAPAAGVDPSESSCGGGCCRFTWRAR